jgi:hypothetical protein
VIEEWATWSSWRGSVGLVRHIAEKVVQAIGNGAQARITVAVFDDEEVFNSISEFVCDITTDALRDFHRLTIHANDPVLSAEVIFTRERWSAPKPRDPSEVMLTVTSLTTEGSDRVVEIAHSACVALRRGHRSWIGQTTGSVGIEGGWRGPSVKRPRHAAAVGRFLVGAGFTVLALTTISALLPKHPISGTAQLLIAVVASVASVHVLSELVPSIEIAEPGKTRLARAVRWGGVTTISLVATQIATHAFGTS